MGIRSKGYAVRRVKQTLTGFRNGPAVLWNLARSSDEITFRTRRGVELHAPNVPGARFPVYEVHIDDIYDLDTVLDGLPAEVTVVDIGAHIGSFSTAVGIRMPGATIHAYEASPSTADWLQRNITANGLDERVTVHRQAVAGSRGEIEFIDNGSASAHNGMTAPEAMGGHIVTVPSVPWADVVAAAGPVHVVKADAEGAEYGLILGSDPAQWESVQRVVMEYHPVDGNSFDELVEFFAGVGISLVRQVPIGDGGLGSAWFARTA